MGPKLLLAALLATAQPAPEWRTAPETDILLRPFAYEPKVIRLRAGEPVTLRFVNNSRSTLSFSAPAFFRAARIRLGDRRELSESDYRLAPGQWLSVALVPAPGRYRVRSRNVAHRILGMSAIILVE